MRLVLQMWIAEARGGEWCVLRCVAQPGGIWSADVNDGVVHMLAVGRVDFRHPDPFVFGESGRNDLVRVLDLAASWNQHRLRHLDYSIGSRNVPYLAPLLQ